jgi:hypothetical protein
MSEFLTTDEPRKVEITISSRDGQILTDTALPDEFDSEEIAFAYMSSLVSILRTAGCDDEEIPEIVRDNLWGAMTGRSVVKVG